MNVLVGGVVFNNCTYVGGAYGHDLREYILLPTSPTDGSLIKAERLEPRALNAGSGRRVGVIKFLPSGSASLITACTFRFLLGTACLGVAQYWAVWRLSIRGNRSVTLFITLE